MRKMTKMAVTLAAMSAMTVAAASMAFAAEDGWSGNDKDGWTYVEDGVKLKNTWAEIDGTWYLFHKDGKMAQDEMLYIDGETYYFHPDGRMMANGWLKVTSDKDAYGDLEINEDLESKSNQASQEDWAYSYHDYVWCYFDESGAAKENEWFQDASGLWYYFDGNVMVMNTMNYKINPVNDDKADSKNTAIYGFDKNGAMLVGWNYKEGSTTWNGPTADAKGKTWYYYASNGKMQGVGWKKIDGNWYLFSNAENLIGTDDYDDNDTYGAPSALIVNSYVESYPDKAILGTKPEYFYMDEDGKMQTGVVELPKKLNYVQFYLGDKSIDSVYQTVTNSGKPEVYFGSKGAAEEKLVNDRFYTLSDMGGDAVVAAVDFATEVTKLSNTAIDVTVADPASAAVTGYDVENYYGRVIKNAFIGTDKDTLYLADGDGDIVTYKAVLVDTDTYVLFNRYGEAYTGYDSKNKSVVIGGKTYWSTGADITIANATVSVFSINKAE